MSRHLRVVFRIIVDSGAASRAVGGKDRFMAPSRASLSLILLAALGLPACLGLSACGGAPQRESFDLGGPGGAARTLARPLRGTLAVAEPLAVQPIDSDRIVVRTGPNEVANLAEAQWVDRLPRLVQARLIAAFDIGRATGSVVRAGMIADRVLATEIRRFEIDVTSGEAIVEIAAKMLDARGAPIGHGRVFSGRAPAPHSTGAAATQALDEALTATVGQIVRWTAAQV
jgi:cholesterol transport system auxiliary component